MTQAKYIRKSEGGYTCVKCGKTIKGPEGFSPHTAWHRKNEKTPEGKRVVQTKLSDEKPAEHTATCTCHDCEFDREMTGK